jgi:hypothetical protein
VLAPGAGLPANRHPSADARSVGPVMAVPLTGDLGPRGALALMRDVGQPPFCDGDPELVEGLAREDSVARQKTVRDLDATLGQIHETIPALRHSGQDQQTAATQPPSSSGSATCNCRSTAARPTPSRGAWTTIELARSDGSSSTCPAPSLTGQRAVRCSSRHRLVGTCSQPAPSRMHWCTLKIAASRSQPRDRRLSAPPLGAGLKESTVVLPEQRHDEHRAAHQSQGLGSAVREMARDLTVVGRLQGLVTQAAELADGSTAAFLQLSPDGTHRSSPRRGGAARSAQPRGATRPPPW